MGSSNSDTGDTFQLRNPQTHLDKRAGSWLVGEGIRYLHAVDEHGIQAYKHVTELLKKCGDAAELVGAALKETQAADIPLRWGLLHLLADLEDSSAVDLFVEVAVEPIPEVKNREEACETIWDDEVLVRTMAISGLARVAGEKSEQGLLSLLRKIEEPVLRVEVVKALLKQNPKNADQIQEILPKDQHYMLYIRCAEREELVVETDRQETQDKIARAPLLDQPKAAPSTECQRGVK